MNIIKEILSENGGNLSTIRILATFIIVWADLGLIIGPLFAKGYQKGKEKGKE